MVLINLITSLACQAGERQALGLCMHPPSSFGTKPISEPKIRGSHEAVVQKFITDD